MNLSLGLVSEFPGTSERLIRPECAAGPFPYDGKGTAGPINMTSSILRLNRRYRALKPIA